MREHTINRRSEFDIRVIVPSLDLEVDLGGIDLIQGWGHVRGHDFFFHARRGEWTIEFCDAEGRLPSDVGHPPVYMEEGRYPREHRLTVNDAVPIVEAAAARFFESREEV